MTKHDIGAGSFADQNAQKAGPMRELSAPHPAALTARQRRFVDEYLVDVNATQAAYRAGYSARTANVSGCDNLRKPNIASAIAAAQAKRARQAGQRMLTNVDIAAAITRITQAAIRARYSDHAAKVTGCRMLTNANIAGAPRMLTNANVGGAVATAAQAAIRAGYSKRTANQMGPALLVNLGIAAASMAARGDGGAREFCEFCAPIKAAAGAGYVAFLAAEKEAAATAMSGFDRFSAPHDRSAGIPPLEADHAR